MKQLLIISLLILSSCSVFTPQKRLARLIKKHPQLVRIDTAVVHDTINIVTERTFRDSIFTIQQARQDTIVVRENNLTIRTIIKGDTVYLSGECDTIIKTVVRHVKVPYQTIVNEPKTKWLNYVFIVLLLLVVFLLYKVGKNFFKKDNLVS